MTQPTISITNIANVKASDSMIQSTVSITNIAIVQDFNSMIQPSVSITKLENNTMESHVTKGPQPNRYYFLYVSTVVVIVLGISLEVIVAWYRGDQTMLDTVIISI
jgi:hypothetical protein